MYMVVDRITEGVVVCEDISGRRHEFHISELPEGIKEGDVLERNLSMNPEETQRRRDYMRRLIDDVFE